MDKIVSNDYSHLKANFEIQVLLLHSFKKISYFHKFSINLLSSIDSYTTANELKYLYYSVSASMYYKTIKHYFFSFTCSYIFLFFVTLVM